MKKLCLIRMTVAGQIPETWTTVVEADYDDMQHLLQSVHAHTEATFGYVLVELNETAQRKHEARKEIRQKLHAQRLLPKRYLQRLRDAKPTPVRKR